LVALPILTTVIANEIQKLLDEPSSSIEMQVIVDPQHGKCISVQYKGPPSDALVTITREIEKCLPQASLHPAKSTVVAQRQPTSPVVARDQTNSPVLPNARLPIAVHEEPSDGKKDAPK
jgi:hypothetical protein